MYICTLKPLKTKKEERKLKFKRLGATSYQNHSDVIMTSLLPSCQKSEGESQQYSVICDNTERSNSEMNQLVHVSQYTNNKYTLKPSKTRKEEGVVNCQHSSDVIISDVIIRDIDVNKPIARKRYAQKKHSLVHTKGFLKSSLRVCSQTFTKVSLMLAIVISILGGVFNVKLPERISTIGTSSSSPHSNPRTTSCCHGYPTLSKPTFARNVLAGKHLDTYIFPSADFWASRAYYLETYTVNLESDYNFTVFYDVIYIYIYIYILFTVHGHPVTGQPTQGLFYILWFIFP